MPNLLYYLTNTGMALLGLITGYLVIMAILALIGLLPKNMDSTFELPLNLQNMETFYIPEDLDNKFRSTHIEVKQANLEILPQDRTWPQTLGYLHAALYLSFFSCILFFLSKLMKTFGTNRPFSSGNTNYLRWIGALTIGLSLYEFIIMSAVALVFKGKFTVVNASISSIPSFWAFDFIALFLGMVFLVLSSVFKTGSDLQELEDLTV